MVMFIVQKFIATAFTLSCPVPGGIFTPTFALGAVLGQLYVASLRRVLLFVGVKNYIQCKYRQFDSIRFDLGFYTQIEECTPSWVPRP